MGSQKVKCQLNPFNFKEDKWPEDEKVQQLNLGKKDDNEQCQFKRSLYIIDGTEKPELYVKFMKSFEFNILRRKLRLGVILDTLIQLVQGEAARVVARVLDKTWTVVTKTQRVHLEEGAFTAWLTVHEVAKLPVE